MANTNYGQRVDELLRDYRKGKDLAVNWEGVAGARAQIARIRQTEKELRFIKREIGLTKREIRSDYAARKAHVGKGFMGGVEIGLFGKKVAGHAHVAERQSIQHHEQRALEPYEAVEKRIETALITFDRVRLDLERWIAERDS